MRVFVLLEQGKGDPAWRERYRRGEVYEQTPYGYGLAEGDGVSVTFSRDRREGPVGSFTRRAVYKVLGFDLLHVLRQVPLAREADVVWTHTEREHLALGLLKGLGRDLPPVVAQSVWVADRWREWSAPRRALYRWCLGHLESLTTLAPDNAAFLRALTGAPVEVVPFGVRADPWPGSAPAADAADAADGTPRPVRVLCLGNDVHRDWELLRELARAGGAEVDVTLVTKRLDPSFAAGLPNLHVRPARRVEETADAYAAADVVCLPLKRNLHASGITVLLEAATWSLPCVVSDTGGLREYFGDEAVRYVPEGAGATSWWEAVRDVARSSGPALVAGMRHRVQRAELTDAGYAARHVALSEALVTSRQELSVPTK
ncbi:glycosyltransferase [Kineococcus sp. SYSU DK005]|uniref:glycosyltransferase n=1 Tax=Kineococcus sp. SYSU DK005 TaxID=3383126 RepID=UPI003D7D3F73